MLSFDELQWYGVERRWVSVEQQSAVLYVDADTMNNGVRLRAAKVSEDHGEIAVLFLRRTSLGGNEQCWVVASGNGLC